MINAALRGKPDVGNPRVALTYKILALAAFAAVALGEAVAFADSKPVIVIGHRADAQPFLSDVLAPASIVCSRDGWMSPEKYVRFSAVYLGGTVKRLPPKDGWAGDANLAAVRKYLEDGGVIILSRLAAGFLLEGQPKAADIIGFSRVKRFTGVEGVRMEDTGEVRDWCRDKDVLVPDGLLPGTKVLARFLPDKGKDEGVAATMRKVGKGTVYWVQMTYASLKGEYARAGRPLTIDGPAGENILSAEGKSLDDFAKFYLGLVKTAADIKVEYKEDGWGLEPLGPEGHLVLDGTFENKPKFLPRKTPRGVFTLVGKGVKACVVTPPGDSVAAQLADELAWHISEMTGEKIEVVDKVPSAGPAIVLVPDEKLKHEQMSISRDGRIVTLRGEGAGLSHAATYFLEALGCRYIWPGRSGKIIPKRNPLLMPELKVDFVPAMHARGMRGGDVFTENAMKGSRVESGLKHFGIDPETWRKAFNAARIDREGNRDFYRWHGICDNEDWKGAYTDSKSPWKWGHYFKDFWIRYGKTHPEWFALQMSGTRFQNLGRRQERPTLCLSNRELAKETARRLAEQLDLYPQKTAWTVGLPDGGATQDCMCPNCRALDPRNSVREQWTFFNPKTAQREKYTYVPITDRYVTFMNRVMEDLRKLRPGKELTFYAYNHYTLPPISVKPDPGLICLSTSGSYRNMNGRGCANIAKWQRICKRVMWRTNALWGFNQSAVPQNFARAIATDLECMKANGLLGTDFDCMSNDWAVKGLVYYAVAKSLLNPDCLSPEDAIADYCEAGFGAAADAVKEYFSELEKAMDRAATTVAENEKKNAYTTDDQERRLLDLATITGAVDLPRLAAALDRAEKLAAKDQAVMERLRFLRLGFECARLEKALCETRGKDGAKYAALQREYADFLRSTAVEHPLAVAVAGLARSNPFMNGYDAKPENAK